MTNMNINQIIKKRLQLLENSNHTLKDLFNIIHSDEECVFCERNNGYKIVRTTYKECKKYAKQMGSYLYEQLKVISKHSYVGLMMENKLEFITVFFGLLMAGYIPVLLNVRLGIVLNDEIINRLNIKCVIADDDYQIACNKIIIKDFEYNNEIINENNFEWENKIAISTSATSLNVKVCVYDGAAICEQIKNTKTICQTNSLIKSHVNGYLKQLAFLPFYHIFGLMATYFWFAFFGRTFVFLKDYSNDTILRTIKKHEVTHIFAVPLLWHTIHKEIVKEVSKQDDKTKRKFEKGIKLSNKLQSIWPKLGLLFAKKAFRKVRSQVFGDSVQFMISGGSYLSKEASEVINGIGYPLYNGYGMSEIGITSVELSLKASERIKTSIGNSFERVEYKVSENGTLLVKSKGICSKIITKEETIEIDNEQYFNTNDLVKADKKHKLYILGRIDDVILTENGEKINPDVIEKQLKFYHVERYSLLGIRQDDKTLTSLILEIKPNISQVKINKIIKEVENQVDTLKKLNFVIDQIYYTYDPICSLKAIKVSRRILTKWIETRKVNLLPFNEFKGCSKVDLSSLEIKIAEEVKSIFAEVLGKKIEEINIDSHFIFDLGGTSLDYLTVLVKLEETYDINVNNSDDYCYSVLMFTKQIIKNIK